MHITHETPEQSVRRLRRVARLTTVELLDGEWSFEQVSQPHLDLRPDTLALIRDGERWSRLVPATPSSAERFRVWSCHFPEGIDNSGFVGWLAGEIKARTGSGVFVICGFNPSRGGIHDYWGCTVQAGDAVITELRALTGPLLDGVRLRPVARSSAGVIEPETAFDFSEREGRVVASYAGGAVKAGFLIGARRETRLTFRYVQVDQAGTVDGGSSTCELSVLPDGRLRITEHFQWASRQGEGTNIIEEADD
jgi:hypothetical protein